MIKLVADQFLIRIQFCNTFDMKKKVSQFKNIYTTFFNYMFYFN